MRRLLFCLSCCLLVGSTCNEDPVPPTDPPSVGGVRRFYLDSSQVTAQWEQCGYAKVCLKSFNINFKFILKDEDNQLIDTNWTADVAVMGWGDVSNDVFVGNTASDWLSSRTGRFNGIPVRGRTTGIDGRVWDTRLPTMRKVKADNGILEVNVGSTRLKPDGSLFPPYKDGSGGYSPFSPVSVALRIRAGQNPDKSPRYLYAGVDIEPYRSALIIGMQDFGIRQSPYTPEYAETQWKMLRAIWLDVPETQPAPQSPQRFALFALSTEPPPLQWTTCPCEVFVDADGDGVSDCFDNCPADPEKTIPGINGCGTPDDAVFCVQFDRDNDGDVDQDDFGVLQREYPIDWTNFNCCFSGPNVPMQNYCQ